jgi:hypothetical protein
MNAAEFELLDETEAMCILAWRFHELIEGGYEVEDALTLAVATEVDVHRASDLLQRGCPPRTALRILL